MNNNNAYVNMASYLQGATQGANDVHLSTLAYDTGPLGRFYLPAGDTSLKDHGSRTAAPAGVYHFTSFANNTKEGNEQSTTVNIGPHYLALDANGGALDSNAHGVPDFIADRNGDGIETSDETPWSAL